jgi:ureidoacrylate peracid hydrolase
MRLDRERSALLVVDMEADFVHGPMAVPGAPELAGRLAPVLRAAREAGVLVIFTTQALRAGGGDLGPLARFSPVRDGLALREGTAGVRVVAELEPREGDLQVVKRRFSAFHATDLDLVLRSRGIVQLVVCGVSAHVCCDTSVRDAFQLGYDTIYVSDGVEMGDLPDLGFGVIPAAQAKAVVATTIAHRFGRLCTLDELAAELTR